jgi:hypothetical protein
VIRRLWVQFPSNAKWKWCQKHAWLMIVGAWLSSQILQMIDKPIVCWEVKNRVAIWPFLKLFARNKIVWPFGHFLAFFECRRK